jgi:dTDP-L-rhamnose 4-epimerase
MEGRIFDIPRKVIFYGGSIKGVKNRFMKKKVLVTGGAGFIGKEVIELISSDYKISILDNLSEQIHGDADLIPGWIKSSDFEFVRGCITDRVALRAALKNCHFVIHLAAETGTGQSMYEVAKYYETNVLGTAILMEEIINSDTPVERVVLTSSRSVYGEGAYVCQLDCSRGERIYPQSRSHRDLINHSWEHICPNCGKGLTPIPTKESDMTLPASVYAATKFAQEEIVRLTCQPRGIDYKILRLQNVYGRGQSLKNPYTGILSIFSTRIRLGKDLGIFEDGNETRDFVHVADVAKVVARVLKNDHQPTLINVGSGDFITVMEISDMLVKAFSADVKIKITGEFRLGDIRHNCADIGVLNGILRKSEMITIEQGISDFVSWVSSQPIERDLLDIANKELQSRQLMDG